MCTSFHHEFSVNYKSLLCAGPVFLYVLTVCRNLISRRFEAQAMMAVVVAGLLVAYGQLPKKYTITVYIVTIFVNTILVLYHYLNNSSVEHYSKEQCLPQYICKTTILFNPQVAVAQIIYEHAKFDNAKM